jgi:DNA polymerase-3 subunit gamma/tau
VAYQVLARKYRPQRFEEIIGQDHVVQTLKNAIATGRIAHAFLFVGPRGIGKTSTARILAMALNAPDGPRVDYDPEDDICREIAEGRSMDVLEIDGASNNNVDQIRELRDNVQYTPSKGKYKIYIIDEVHMLSQAAFNALLKTLEEPPAHVKFIFATTEPQKVLATILSRCQRFDLKRISDHDIKNQLQMIADTEGIKIDSEALKIIARNAEGGMRDAESALDQLISFCGDTIKEADALEVFGLTGHREIWSLAEAILAGASEDALRQVRDLVSRGKDLTRLTQELLRYFRNLLIFIVSRSTAEQDLDETEYHHYEAMQPLPGANMVLALIDEIVHLEEKIRFALVKEVLFEISILRMAQQREKVRIEDVIRELTGGKPAPEPSEVLPPSPAKPAQAPSAKEPAKQPATPPAEQDASPDQSWLEVARAFKDTNDLVIRRALETCTFDQLRDGQIHVRMVASKDIYQALVNSASMKKLEKQAVKIFGPGSRLTLHFEERVEKEPEPDAEPAAPRPDKEEAPSGPGEFSQAEFENDPLIQSALKTFEAKIVDIKQKA